MSPFPGRALPLESARINPSHWVFPIHIRPTTVGRAERLRTGLRGDIPMQEEYVVPELKLVGNASEVVLGGIGVGGDISGMWTLGVMEFEED
jgi:hypothetical protein